MHAEHPLVPAPLDAPAPVPVILYDGDCGVCQRVAAGLTARHGGSVAVWRPWQGEPQLPPGLSTSRLGREVVMVGAGGELIGGHRVFARVLRRTPGWRGLGLLLGVPGAGVVARLVYRLIASRRRWLSQRLGLQACPLPRSTSIPRKERHE